MRCVRVFSPLAGAFLSLLLASCVTLPFVEPYDADIEQALNDYDKAVNKFVKDMQGATGGKQHYDSDEAKQFYSDSNAILANAVVRAEALSVAKTCPLSKPLAIVLTNIGTAMAAQPVGTTSDPIVAQTVADLQQADTTAELTSGSCTVVILRAVKANNELLETIHRELNGLPNPAGSIALENIEDTVRVALTNELAKKRQ